MHFCEKCDNMYYIKVSDSTGNNNNLVYYCRKCSESKRKKSLLKSHGCEYPIQNKKVYRKIKQTISQNKKLL